MVLRHSCFHFDMSEVEWQVNELGNLAPRWGRAVSFNQECSICQLSIWANSMSEKEYQKNRSPILMTVLSKKPMAERTQSSDWDTGLLTHSWEESPWEGTLEALVSLSKLEPCRGEGHFINTNLLQLEGLISSWTLYPLWLTVLKSWWLLQHL